MIAKTITLKLGGQDRTLLYGVNGYFEHIKDAAGMDPFAWLEKFDNNREDMGGDKIMTFIDDTAIMVYAGLNSFLDSTDQANLPIEKVKKWCNGLSSAEVTEIYKTAFGTIQTEKSGELVPNQDNGQKTVSA